MPPNKALRIFVTGASGQLATKLAQLDGNGDVRICALGRPQLDICDPATITAAIGHFRPDVIVNSAAYTAVDRAEDEPEAAFAINRDGARNVAVTAAGAKLPVIHVSTDYVFSGTKPSPYTEDDETGPTGVYGRSKLEGERAVASANPRHLIIRTAWVYSDHGNNFLKTMLRLAADRDEITVVADQFGNPTSAADLAAGIVVAARKITAESGFAGYGIYNLTGGESMSWASFAREIFKASRAQGGPGAEVVDIPTSSFPTRAQRPLNSRLAIDKFVTEFRWQPPALAVSIGGVVPEVLAGSNDKKRNTGTGGEDS